MVQYFFCMGSDEVYCVYNRHKKCSVGAVKHFVCLLLVNVSLEDKDSTCLPLSDTTRVGVADGGSTVVMMKSLLPTSVVLCLWSQGHFGPVTAKVTRTDCEITLTFAGPHPPADSQFVVLEIHHRNHHTDKIRLYLTPQEFTHYNSKNF